MVEHEHETKAERWIEWWMMTPIESTCVLISVFLRRKSSKTRSTPHCYILSFFDK